MSRRRVWTAALVLFALLIELPAVTAPFSTDDYDQAAMMDGGYPGRRGPFNLYDFINDTNRAEILDRGIFPWFTSPKLTVRFLRPLSSALLWADHQLFGQNALWPHIHSLLWWAAACCAVHALLRQSFSSRIAWMGTIVFTLAPCHSLPLAWLANREALVSAALGTLALAAYARWREARKKGDGLLAFLLFTLALLAGEYSLGFTGYVLAMEVVRPRESVARRARGLACFALPLAGYLAAHRLLGYGATGAAFYRDPINDLATFLRGSPQRLALLVDTAWLGLSDRWWYWTPSWTPAAMAVVLASVLTIPIVRVVRTLVGEERRRAKWMLFGSLLCLVPALSVEPSVRLLGVTMVGISGVVALTIDHAWFPPEPLEPRRGAAELTGLVALGLAFVHYFLGPVDTWLANRENARIPRVFNERAAWVHDHAGERSTVVALRASSFLLSMPLIFRERVRWRLLTLASPRSLVLRTGDRAIDMISNPAPLMPNPLQVLFRSELLRPGEIVELADMRATVLQVDGDGAPRRIRFEFDRDLDDPSMFWIAEGPDGFREQKLPAVGYAELIELGPS